MATKTSGIAWYHYVLFLLLPIIIGAKLFWDWFKNRSMSQDLMGMFSKNETQPELRKRRAAYKDALNIAIRKAAKKLEENDRKEYKKEDGIKAYKDENEEETEIVSYKNENESELKK